MTNLRTSQRDVIDDNDRDRGSSLVLALVFLTAIALLVMALVNLAGTALLDTKKFNTATNVVYSAAAAVQVEIQAVRYEYQTTNLTPTNCTPGDPPPIASNAAWSINNVKISVFCTYQDAPTTGISRAVTFYACEEDGATYVDAAACMASPFLQAQVTFNDFTISDQNQCASGVLQTSCGTSMKIAYWLSN